MRFGDHNISKELLLTVDFMNTINGGMAKVRFNFNREHSRYVANVMIPGVKPQDIKVEIKNNFLTVYYFLKFGEDGSYEEIKNIPYVLCHFMIPFDVKIADIHARSETDTLQVILPFNELADGYRKEISVDKS